MAAPVAHLVACRTCKRLRTVMVRSLSKYDRQAFVCPACVVIEQPVQIESSLRCRDHEGADCSRCGGTLIEPCSGCGEPTSVTVESDGETYCPTCHAIPTAGSAAVAA